jgi:hypothetical protein
MKNLSIAVCLSLLSAWAAHAQGPDLYASINHPNVTGPGAVYKYTTAGVQNTVVASVVQPRGLAFDSFGNLFVASTDFDSNGNFVGSILEVTPDGTVSTFATGFPTNFFLLGLALDTAGDVFVMGENTSDPNLASTIFEVSPGGAISTFGTIPGLGQGVAFDSNGNLFAADGGDHTIFVFTPTGMRSVFAGPESFLPTEGPRDLAFNSAGNLFASTLLVDATGNSTGNGRVLEFTPNGVETTFGTGLTNEPRGIAIDSTGNLFVAEIGHNRPGDILKFTPAGGAPTVFAIAGRPQGNGGPEFLAFPRPMLTFVIGDLNAVVGNHVTFWGADWARQNSLSGGPAPNSFKGFANSPTPNPPACGGTWTSDPGNSSGPPNAVAPYITVIVSSSITQSGSTISGNIPELVVVKTGPGYAPKPGHPGTGTVTAIICHQ